MQAEYILTFKKNEEYIVAVQSYYYLLFIIYNLIISILITLGINCYM